MRRQPPTAAQRRAAIVPVDSEHSAIFQALQAGRHEEVDRVVVVNLASTEAYRADSDDWSSLSAFEEALERGRAQPASLL